MYSLQALIPAVSDDDRSGPELVKICIGGSVEGFVATTKQCVNVNIREEVYVLQEIVTISTIT